MRWLLLLLCLSLSTLSRAAVFTVTNTNTSGAGSLNQAISDANATLALDTIKFNITGSAPFTITITGSLNTITQPVLIDGSSQTGWTASGAPVIRIDYTNDIWPINISNTTNVTLQHIDFSRQSATNPVGRGVAISGSRFIVVKNCRFNYRYQCVQIDNSMNVTVNKVQMTGSGWTTNEPAIYILNSNKSANGIAISECKFGQNASRNTCVLRLNNASSFVIGNQTVAGANIVLEDTCGLNILGTNQTLMYFANVNNISLQKLNIKGDWNYGGTAISIANPISLGAIKLLNNSIINFRGALSISGGYDYTVEGNNFSGSGYYHGQPIINLSGLVSRNISGGISLKKNKYSPPVGSTNEPGSIVFTAMSNLYVSNGTILGSNIAFEDTSGIKTLGPNTGNYLLQFVSCNQVTLEKVDLSYQTSTSNAAIAVMFSNSKTQSGFTVKNCKINNRRTAVYINGGADLTVESNDFQYSGLSNGNPAIYINGVVPYKIKGGIKISKNKYGGSGYTYGALLSLYSADSIIVSNGTTAGTHIAFEDTSGISNMRCNNSNTTPILYFNHCNNLLVEKIQMSAPLTTIREGIGIIIDNNNQVNKNVTIRNNSIKNRYAGIFVNSSAGVNVYGNNLSNTGNDYSNPALRFTNIPSNELSVYSNKFGGTLTPGGALYMYACEDVKVSNGSLTGGSNVRFEDTSGLNNYSNNSNEMLFFQYCSNLEIDRVNVGRPSGVGGTGIYVNNPEYMGTIKITNCNVSRHNTGISVTGHAITIDKNNLQESGTSESQPAIYVGGNGRYGSLLSVKANKFGGTNSSTIFSAANVNGLTISDGSLAGSNVVFEDTCGMNNCANNTAAAVIVINTCNSVIVDSLYMKMPGTTPIKRAFLITGTAVKPGPLTIRNCRMENFKTGVYAASVKDVTIENNLLYRTGENNGYPAILLSEIDGQNNSGVLSIKGNKFGPLSGVGNTYTAFYFDRIRNLNIGNGTVAGTNMDIENNCGLRESGTNNYNLFYFINCANISIKKVDLSYSNSSIRQGMTLNFNSTSYYSLYKNYTIDSCNFSNRYSGIYMQGGYDYTIKNSVFKNVGTNYGYPIFQAISVRGNSIAGGLKIFKNVYGGSANNTLLNLSDVQNLLISNGSRPSTSIALEDTSGITGFADRVISISNSEKITIDSLNLTRATGSGTDLAIYADNTTGLTIKNCTLTKRYYGIQASTCNDVTITGNDLRGTGQASGYFAISVNNIGATGLVAGGLKIAKNKFGGGNAQNGIGIFNCANLLISDGSVAGSNVEIESTSGIDSVGSVYALQVQSCKNIVLSNLNLSKTGTRTGTGLNVDNCKAVEVNKCTFNNRSSGLVISGGGSGIKVNCGTFTNNVTGISVSGQTGNVIVTGSTISGNGTSGGINGSSPVIAAYNYWGGGSPTGNYSGTVTTAPYYTAGPNCPASQPEIDVWGNQVSITDGNSTPNINDNSKMGYAKYTSTSTYTITRPFLVKNSGTANLTISSISFSGTHAADFSVSGISSGQTLLPGETDTLYITGNPSDTGTRTGRIEINSNDTSEATFDFAVSFYAKRPIVVTNTSNTGAGSLRQATIDANAATGLDFIDFNIGTGAQVIAYTSNPQGFTDGVVIDGTTQPGYSGTNLITVRGTSSFGESWLININYNGEFTTLRALDVDQNWNTSGMLHYGAYLNNVKYPIIDKCRFKGLRQAVYLQSCSDGIVTNNDMRGSGDATSRPSLYVYAPTKIAIQGGLRALNNLFGPTVSTVINPNTYLRIDNATDVLIDTVDGQNVNVVLKYADGVRKRGAGDWRFYFSNINNFTMRSVLVSDASTSDQGYGIYFNGTFKNTNLKNVVLKNLISALYFSNATSLTNVYNCDLSGSGYNETNSAINVYNSPDSSKLHIRGNKYGRISGSNYGNAIFSINNSYNQYFSNGSTAANIIVEDTSGFKNALSNYLVTLYFTTNINFNKIDFSSTTTTGLNGTGIYLRNMCLGVTVKNCKFQYRQSGFYALGEGKDYDIQDCDFRFSGSNTNVASIRITNCKSWTLPAGVYIKGISGGSSPTTYSNCFLSMDNMNNQVISDGSYANTNIFVGDSTARNYHGDWVMYMSSMSNFIMDKVNLTRKFSSGASGNGIFVGNFGSSAYTKITNCTIKRRNTGIYISGGNDATIENNALDTCGSDDNNPALYMDLVGSNVLNGGVSVKNNRFGYYNSALRFQRMKNLIVSDGSIAGSNVVLPSTSGITTMQGGTQVFFYGVDSSRIEKLSLSKSTAGQSGTGIRVYGYSPNTTDINHYAGIRIANNTIANRSFGIYIDRGEDYVIDSNYLGRTGNSSNNPAMYLRYLESGKTPGGFLARGNRWGGTNTACALRMDYMKDVIVSDGSVANTNITVKTQDSMFNMTGSSAILYNEVISNVQFAKLDLAYRSSSIGGGTAIRVYNVSENAMPGNISIKNCNFQYRNNGVYVDYGRDYEITGNDFRNTGSGGSQASIYLNSISKRNYAGGIKAHANVFGNTGVTALYFNQLSGVVVTDSVNGFSDFTIKDNSGLNTLPGNLSNYCFMHSDCKDFVYNNIELSYTGTLQSGMAMSFTSSNNTAGGNVIVKNCNIQNRAKGLYASNGFDYVIDSNNFQKTSYGTSYPTLQLSGILGTAIKNGVKAKANLFSTAVSSSLAFQLDNFPALVIKNKPSANTNISIEDNSGIDKITDAIYINNSSNILLDSLKLDYYSGTNGVGISINNNSYGAQGNIKLTNSSIKNRTRGIYINRGRDYTVIGNKFHNSGSASGSDWACMSFIGVTGDSVKMGVNARNNIFGGTTSQRAFYLSSMDSLMISSKLSDNPQVYIQMKDSIRFVNYECIRLVSIDNLTVKDLELSYAGTSRAGTGLSVSSVRIANVTGNTVANRSYGLYFQGNSGTLTDFKINRNTLIDNAEGYSFYSSLPTKLQSRNNTFECNTRAVVASGGNVTVDSSYWGSASAPTNGGANGYTISGGTFTYSPNLTVKPAGTPEPTQVELVGNNQSVLHNDTIVSFLDSTNFGAQDADSLVVRYKLKIKGTGMYKFSGTPKIQLTGKHAADFRILDQPSSAYMFNGDSFTFRVSFNAKDTGRRIARLKIPTSDCDNSNFYVGIEATGLPGRTLLFDGVNDYLVSNSNMGITGNQPRTMEFWFKKNSSATNSHIAGWGQSSVANAPFGLYVSNNQLVFYAWNDFNTGYTIDNNWHHYAVTYDGTTVRTFVDGKSTPVPSATRSLSTVNSKLYIGVRDDLDPATYVGGRIDEVRVWNRELDTCEIQLRRNNEISGTQNGLVVYYRFNQGLAGGNNTAITTTPDSSGNGNYATYTNLAMRSEKSNLVGFVGINTVKKLPKYLEPEIAVLNKLTEIADNDITPSVSDSTHFGEVIKGDSLVIRYKVKNTGTDTLKFTGAPYVQISGADASQFVVKTQLPAFVKKGDSAIFSIAFKPTSTGVKNAKIVINNNDCTEQPYDFSIQGDAKLPGAALSFDGANDVVSTATNSLFNTPYATVESWVNLNDKSTSRRIVINKASGSYRYELYYDQAADRFACGFMIGSTYYRLNATSSPSLNTWYHVAATYGGDTLKLYLNGTEVNRQAIAGTISSATAKISIGADEASPSTFPMNGSIDEVRIWNRARTAAEISANMNCEIANAPCGYVAYYKFNQGKAAGSNSGLDSLVDAWPNKLKATLSNFALTGSNSNWVATGGVVSGTSCSIVAEPEIAINGNYSPIADGSTTVALSNYTDFGTVSLTDSISYTFKIKNTGSGTLTLSGSPKVSVTGTGAAKFTVTSQPSATIASGDSSSFTLKFKSLTAGTYNATVNVQSNDCDEDLYDFAIKGIAQPPCDSTKAMPSSLGLHRSAITTVSPGGFTCYCNSSNELLLMIKKSGTGVVIPDTGVTLKITAGGASLYPHGTGFVGNFYPYAALNRTWDVAATTQPSSPVTVRLPFNSTDLSDVNYTLSGAGEAPLPNRNGVVFYKVINSAKPAHSSIPNLQISDVKLQVKGSAATDSTYIWRDVTTNDWLAEFQVTHFSGGGGGGATGGSIPLNTGVLDFKATRSSYSNVELRFAMSSEQGVKGYVIERKLATESDFKPLIDQNAKGVLSPVNYLLKDANNTSSLSWYRIKVIENNGQSHYGPVRQVQNTVVPGKVILYPNPVKGGELQVKAADRSTLKEIVVTDMAGKTVYNSGVLNTEKVQIRLGNVAPGQYLLKVTTSEGAVMTEKITVQE